MRANKKLAAVAGAALLAARAVAAPSVEITNVQQQYPWTNTVDITYTVAGVKDFPAKTATGGYASNETYFVTFEAKNGNNPIKDVNGNTVFTNALVNGSGANQVAQWHPALGQQLIGCTLTPSVFRGEDDAYLIVNLETNALGKNDYWYEPMSTQEASNKRYNTDEYKTTKMVFRRIKAGVWPVRRWNDKSVEYATTVNMEKDYYMGIFAVTVAQYNRIMGKPPYTDLRPKCNISWNAIRGNALVQSRITPSDTGDAVQRLNRGTGLNFDLPTFAMAQAAIHANASKDWPWFFGDTAADLKNYARYQGGLLKTFGVVGSLSANPWGLYDVYGNIDEMCLDCVTARGWNGKVSSQDISTTQQPSQFGTTVVIRACNFSNNNSIIRTASLCRHNAVNSTWSYNGFRLSLITE